MTQSDMASLLMRQYTIKYQILYGIVIKFLQGINLPINGLITLHTSEILLLKSLVYMSEVGRIYMKDGDSGKDGL